MSQGVGRHRAESEAVDGPEPPEKAHGHAQSGSLDEATIRVPLASRDGSNFRQKICFSTLIVSELCDSPLRDLSFDGGLLG